MLEACRAGLRIAASRGVTAIHDKDGWLGALRAVPAPARARRADAAGVAVAARRAAARPARARAALGLRRRPAARWATSRLFMDGTLGSATARLLDGSGVEITSPRAAGRDRARGRRGGLAGRRARDRRRRQPRRPRRLRGQRRTPGARSGCASASSTPSCSTPPSCRASPALGVAASVQFSHAPSDRDLAERVWEGHRGAYAYRSLLDAGARLANGSDAPVEELDPLQGIVAGVLRTLDERPAWRPEQALTVDEALRATCAEPAWLARDEHRRGTLAPGKLADLVVLDRDPLACPPERAARHRGGGHDGGWTHCLCVRGRHSGHKRRVMKRESWLPAAPESAGDRAGDRARGRAEHGLRRRGHLGSHARHERGGSERRVARHRPAGRAPDPPADRLLRRGHVRRGVRLRQVRRQLPPAPDDGLSGRGMPIIAALADTFELVPRGAARACASASGAWPWRLSLSSGGASSNQTRVPLLALHAPALRHALHQHEAPAAGLVDRPLALGRGEARPGI